MHMPDPQYFQDTQGKIPANVGDPVALVTYGDVEGMIQQVASKRPTLRVKTDGAAWIDGSFNRGEYLESAVLDQSGNGNHAIKSR